MLNAPVAVGITGGHHPDVVRFAAAEAARLGRPLRIIHVSQNPSGDGDVRGDLGRVLNDLPAHVPIEHLSVSGDPATVLLAESQTACRLILGVDHLTGDGAAWSEIAQQVALHAMIPVVIVPVSSPAGAQAPHVVVAVDDAHLTDGPLAYAVEAAEQRAEPLEVVFGAGTTSDYPGRQVHLSRLEDVVDGWRLLHPSVAIRVSVEGGHPVASCVAAGAHASLMVVGRPSGKHPRVGSRSVASKIVRDSKVPVAVVPPDYQTSASPEVAPM